MKTVTLYNDPDSESPSDWDGWKLYSFSHKHSSFKHPNNFFRAGKDGNTIPNLWLAAKLKAGTAFVLSYYEHSSCVWSLRNEGPTCQWDSVNVAGLLIWEQPVKNLGPKTYADREKDARGFCDTYTKWCNGEIYGFSIEDETGEDIDSCGGFYDVEEMAQAVREAVNGDEVTIEGDAAWLADYHDFKSKPSTTEASPPPISE